MEIRPAAPTSLVVLELETFEGASYIFPDIQRETVVAFARQLSLGGPSYSDLTLSNISGAVLVVPWRIVKTVRMDKEIVWASLRA